MRINLTCVQCGKSFERDTGEVNRGRVKYCSLSCFRLSCVGKERPTMRKRIIKKCLRCGQEFETGGRAGKKSKVYCSNRCSKMVRNGSTIANGYKCIRVNGKRTYEHRLIVEKTLGRSLRKDEVIHHNNGDKLNNRPENLTVMSQKIHRSLVDYLAGLWIKEHPDLVNQVTRKYASE